jgi:hypothetical protein
LTTPNARFERRSPFGVTLQAEHQSAEARAAFTQFLALAPSRYERQIADAKQRLTVLGP